ncbi:GNAT family N-acetyltransferase [Streptomyces sp. NPDC058620]|uniref:GNAT family N-acetyltransferase n=1 Tax=Streptomyces sp. NPDC058620 TaxID=3346560 RepID=UPI00365A32E9
MTVIVRDFGPADAEAWVAVRRAALPYMVTTAEQVAFDLAHAHPDKKYRLLVAEEDGEIIGTAQVGFAYDTPEPGQGFCNPYTRPDRLGRGAGSLLLSTAEGYLAEAGAVAVYTWVLDEPANREFARRRGYVASRPAHFLHLDLANGTLPERQVVPAGVELRTAADFGDDPRPLFEADAEATADEPSDTPTEFTDYEDWLNHTWHHPGLDRELTSVAMVDGVGGGGGAGPPPPTPSCPLGHDALRASLGPPHRPGLPGRRPRSMGRHRPLRPLRRIRRTLPGAGGKLPAGRRSGNGHRSTAASAASAAGGASLDRQAAGRHPHRVVSSRASAWVKPCSVGGGSAVTAIVAARPSSVTPGDVW